MLDYAQLTHIAHIIRRNTLYAIGNLGVGHVGGCMSVVEIITTLYFHEMNIDPTNPQKEDRDMLIISKGHSGPTLYSALALKGFFDESWLRTLNKGGTRLPSHCDRNQTPGVDMSTGSLGQGLSCACGAALGAKLKRLKNNVYCIIGDGETDEGQNWEAAMFANHYKLDNLIAFTDYNKLQLDGPVNKVMSLEDLQTKWQAFGFETYKCDGHNIKDIIETLNKCHQKNNKPKMIILDTIKSYGFERLQNKVESHNANISLDEVKEIYKKEVPSWVEK